MKIIPASLLFALIVATCSSTYRAYPPRVDLPDVLSKRAVEDRPALIIDVRDVDGEPAPDAVVTLRMVLSGPEWPDVRLKSAGHFRYVDELDGSVYRIDVALPGHRAERRTLRSGGAHRYETFWMMPPGMRGYFHSGMRWPVTYDGAPELVADTRGDRERVVAAARELGFTVVTRRPRGMRDDLVILRTARASDSTIGALGGELARRTGATIYYVVEHDERFVAVSRALHATLITHPALRGVAEHFHALGFDTTAVHNLGSGLWRLTWRGGPDGRMLDAADSLVRSGAAAGVENDLLQVHDVEPLE